MKRLIPLPTALARRVVGTTLALGLAVTPLQVSAASPPDAAAPAEATPPAETPAEAAPSEAVPATATGNVAILKFDGDDFKGNDFRARVQTSLTEQGFTANFIKRSIAEAAQKNKCKVTDDSCLDKVAAYLNKNSSVAYDYFMWADVPAQGTATVTIWDIKNKKKVVDIAMMTSPNDFILAEVVGPAIAKKLVRTQIPATPATDDEKAVIATLDEPAETPEEIAARQAAIDAAMKEATDNFNAGVDVGAQQVDLKKDFEAFCRTGPRQDQEIEGDDGEVTKERDLRPACKRGPTFGYWQPRAWVALTLTIGSAATMGTMWGLAAAARSDWKAAKNELEASGLVDDDPNNRCNADGVCYEDLAGAVSDATAQIRRRAIVGDVFLGATVLLTGVLAIIIYQDRQAAKDFIGREKEVRALSNLRIAPVFGRTNGAAMSFNF